MKSPFKFLDSYTKDDRAIFFGRDREIEELYQRVFDSKLLLVYGVSGTGKSSLIHCGLANKFLETDWLPLVIRRGVNIIESMAAAVGSASLTKQQNKFASPADFKKAVRSLYLDHYKPVFFIFDQFEELFIFGDREERRSFIHIVKSLTESDLQCRMIFVMREEYMAGITEFEKYIPTIFSNRVRIEKMSHRNALEAIKEPCKVFNISLEEGFAESLLEKLSPGETDVELTYLQVFLDKIFRLALQNLPPFRGAGGSVQPAGGSSPLPENQGGSSQPAGRPSLEPSGFGGSVNFSLSLLTKTGNVSDLLGSFLDDQISLMEDQDTALTLLKSFVSVKGTKQPMTPEEAREYALTLGRDIKENVIRDMIQTFVNLRILCDKDQNGRYELRHDALAAKIFEKFTMTEKELLEVRKYVENAFFTYEKRGIMLNKEDLDYLSVYERKLILPQHLNDFVMTSRSRISRQKKTLTNITRISAIIFILIVAALGRKYLIRQNALRENVLIAKYFLQSQSNPVKSLLNTLELWKKYPSSSILKFIIYSDFNKLISSKGDTSFSVIPLKNLFKPVISDSPVMSARINKERTLIYGSLLNDDIFIFDLQTGKIHSFNPGGKVAAMTVSVKDSLLASLLINNKGSVFNFRGQRLFDFKTSTNSIMNERLVKFWPSSDASLAAADGRLIRIYNKDGAVMYELIGCRDNINSLDISPDGKFICAVSNDTLGLIWNFDSTLHQFRVFGTLKGHTNVPWSCEFSKNGKYILTASADSTIRIWNLMGEQINPWMMFGMNYKGEAKYRQNMGEYDEDKKDPNLSAYYGKNCNASFSDDEMSIIATGYRYMNDSAGCQDVKYTKVLFYDQYHSKFIKLYYNPFIDIAREDNEENSPEDFSDLDVSPSGDLIAGTNKKEVTLIGPEGLRLCSLNGTFAFFSFDGTRLYYIDDKEIRWFPINIQEIRNMLDKYQIKNSVQNNKGVFTVL